MSHEPVIIVGTTPDYVLKIHEKYPGAALFLVDSSYGDHPDLKAVGRDALVFTPHGRCEKTLQTLDDHLFLRDLSPRGVACFDCESLVLASAVARHRGLPFPPLDAILKARNKMASRRAWRKAGILCPDAVAASGLEETLAFFRRAGGDLVLKPLTGSGSELVFHCRDEREVEEAVGAMARGLLARRSSPLYRSQPLFSGKGLFDPCRAWIAEEFISGPEYSCDFFLHSGKATLLRETEKVKAPDQSFGSILAYIFPPRLPETFDRQVFPEHLARAVAGLGFEWGHFMADYILRDGLPVMIEMTPRPGGDSIPDLVEEATGVDMIGIHLDIMAGRFDPARGCAEPQEPLAAINLYADREGTVERIDLTGLASLPPVRKVVSKRKAGDVILLPPEDYDSRLLGYCIVSMKTGLPPAALEKMLHDLMDVSIRDRRRTSENRPGKGGKGIRR